MELDIAIAGAGMAGASLAAFLSGRQRVALLEAEAQPGYHTTGRSAAFYAQTYGGPGIQPMTTASGEFLHRPPRDFAATPLLAPRGALHVARAGEEAALAALVADFAEAGVRLEEVGAARIRALAPQLRPQWSRGLWEPDCQDMDVAALHAGFLKLARARGAILLTDARLVRAERAGGRWVLTTAAGARLSAGVLVNAAGAWADALAALAGVPPLGIVPLRRTVAQLVVDPAPAPTLPLTLDAGGTWYFKPERDRIWVSPHDEIPDVARDVQPEELDVATAIDRLKQATSFRIRRLERAWAGLRCFAPDRLPVLGWDVQVPGFFWCAGQGGFGIQTAPAAGMLCAALLEDRPLPPSLAAAGVRPECYAPKRLSGTSTATGASAGPGASGSSNPLAPPVA